MSTWFFGVESERWVKFETQVAGLRAALEQAQERLCWHLCDAEELAHEGPCIAACEALEHFGGEP